MADRRFFDRAGPFALDALCVLSGARLVDAADGSRRFTDVAPLETAGPEDVSFLENRKYMGAFVSSRAGAAFVDEKAAGQAPPGMAVLVSREPYKAYALAAQAFYPAAVVVARQAPSAIIDATAVVSDDCDIGPNVVIERGVRVGRRCQIGANTVIAAGVEIGDDCRIAANVTLSHCVIGSRVVLHPGVRIGQDGFGFAPDQKTPIKVPQLGRVMIGDDVDIGANTTIDRGSGHDTVIGSGSMIDNLVQIGHNVVLGRCCILAGQVGISGSTRLDDYVMVGGQGGLAGHLHIGSGARIAAKSGLMRDVPAGEAVCGSPAVPLSEFMRQTAVLQRLARRKGGA
ncbi:MAG: UDP-3-O-(3-hydroxymyristoyl)glucosamine N-acyltransferase [Alphaproteobacteria bacterium]|nr:UDP-3-O-(3-hydroxymyristoyl)glucosamine N-acyltransferase [Alphaproteobacteria bacterium]